jgi:hypothetical protein
MMFPRADVHSRANLVRARLPRHLEAIRLAAAHTDMRDRLTILRAAGDDLVTRGSEPLRSDADPSGLGGDAPRSPQA